MTLPRQIFKGRTELLTRSCSERRFFLTPSKETYEAFLYCFAVTAQEHKMDIFWLCVMSNHYHAGVLDKEGERPEFTRDFHSLLTRCLNVHLRRRENLWATEPSSAVHLADADAVFKKMVYSLTNPVKDHLVTKVVNWPGFNSLLCQLNDRPLIVKRPRWFFDENGEMPEEVELRFVRPPEFAHLSQQEWADRIRAAVAKQERKAAEKRERAGTLIIGRKAILRQSPHSCPKRFRACGGLRPRVATRNKWLRIELLQRNKRFQQRYREAFERRRKGDVDVLFPHGTYQLAILGLVRSEPPPTLH